MPYLKIELNIGIGDVKLGMSREEVHKVMGNNYSSFKRGNVNIDAYFSSCFQVNYDERFIVNFIEIASSINTRYSVLFEGMNVFETKVEELVHYIERFRKYNRDDQEAELGCSYIFKDIGLSLWRPAVFKEEMLQEEWFQELSRDQKDDLMRHRYFEAVGLAVKGYWD